jgi:hypothetical protein
MIINVLSPSEGRCDDKRGQTDTPFKLAVTTNHHTQNIADRIIIFSAKKASILVAFFIISSSSLNPF